MKAHFRGYYPYSTDDFKFLWENAIFTFDTNFLRDLFRIKQTLSTHLLEAVEYVKERAWLPYQVAKEFFMGYQDEIQSQANGYETLLDHVRKIPANLNGVMSRHSMLPLEEYTKAAERLVEEITQSVNKVKKEYSSREYYEGILARLDSVFATKMGKEPTTEEHAARVAKCKERFESKTQPGLSDGKKEPEELRYGDAIIWLELMALAKERGKPVICVTSERKPDWWELTQSKNVIGPRRSLLREMFDDSGQLFYLYSTDEFPKQVQQMLGFKPSQSVSEKELKDDIKSAEQNRLSIAEQLENRQLAGLPPRKHRNMDSPRSALHRVIAGKRVREMGQLLGEMKMDIESIKAIRQAIEPNATVDTMTFQNIRTLYQGVLSKYATMRNITHENISRMNGINMKQMADINADADSLLCILVKECEKIDGDFLHKV